MVYTVPAFISYKPVNSLAGHTLIQNKLSNRAGAARIPAEPSLISRQIRITRAIIPQIHESGPENARGHIILKQLRCPRGRTNLNPGRFSLRLNRRIPLNIINMPFHKLPFHSLHKHDTFLHTPRENRIADIQIRDIISR